MNTHRTPRPSRGLTAVVGGYALLTGVLQGAPFLYGPGDLVLAFRQSGSASDLVVNLGKITNYNALAPGASIAVTQLDSTQLTAAFPSLNGLNWSVAAANRPPVLPDYPVQTLWVAAPRLESGVQSSPWIRKGSFVQGTAASQVDSIGVNAAASSSSQPAGPGNTATAVTIPGATDFALAPLIGDAGDFAGTFQGNVENRTADDFDGDPANVSRSDLYELIPGTSAAGTLNTAGRYLGYFEFKPDGSLTFNTGKPPLTNPAITAIVRDGGVTTVSFTTVAGATYQLRATGADSLAESPSTWTAGATVLGTGSVLTLQDTSAEAVRFFAIEARP